MRASSLGLALLAVVTLWLVFNWLRPELETTAAVPRGADGEELPRTYLQQARSRAYGDDGELTEIVTMERADYFAGRQESLLQEPRFYSQQADDTTWSAAAREGVLYPQSEQLLLRHSVRLVNDNSGGTLTTEEMIIDSRRQTARSRSPVTLEDADNITHADRMVVNLDTERVRLLGNIDSRFAAPATTAEPQ